MERTIKVVCYRAEGPGAEGRFQEYVVPVEDDETSLQALLDHIQAHLDPTLAFFRHAACLQGLCGRCAVKLDGRTCLACNEPVPARAGTITVEPANRSRLVRDLLCMIGGE